MAEGFVKIGRVAPVHKGVWNEESAYEKLDIVTNEGMTAAYIARRNVPAGTKLSKRDYWGVLTDFSGDEFIDAVAGRVPMVKVAAQPEFANSTDECTDTSKVYVLPDGHLYAYMKTTTVIPGGVVPDFVNQLDEPETVVKENMRYSHSGQAWKEFQGGYAVVLPIPTSGSITARFRNCGVYYTDAGSSYPGVYAGTTATSFPTDTGVKIDDWIKADNGDYSVTFVNSAGNKYIVCTLNAFDDTAIITINEEIAYKTAPGTTETVIKWTDTGIEYNQPPDYSARVVSLETKTAQLENDVDALENRLNNIGSSPTGGGIDAFAYPAYPPSPQLPGDGSEEADFNVANVTTPEIHAYMDTLRRRYRTYMVRQNLGKDASGQHDYYRYVFSKAYWRAWYKEGYPKMYAWKNGNTVIYSESVSPRVGDTMYVTGYIGTKYSAVSAVNSETIGVASTRTVNGLEFERHADEDVEPTIVYTTPFVITATQMPAAYIDNFARAITVKEYTQEYIVDKNGVKYYRYPFEDRKIDKTRLFSVFILTNEHGNQGDSMIPSVTVMRMLKDLCNNVDVPFLRWLKENAVVTVIPIGNPYGGYNNVNGVNINRNYDTPGWAGSNRDPSGGTKEEGAFGAYAGDQIETQYIMNTIQQCKAQVAMSGHGRGIPGDMILGDYNSSAAFQGCGFDPERMYKVEEALFSMYNFGFSPTGQVIVDQTANNYLNAGKSPSYIEYAGAVGGLIEIDDHEVGTLDSFTPLAMEQAYAEVLLVLQNWCEEALMKSGG